MRKALFYVGMIVLIAVNLGCVGAMLVVKKGQAHYVSVRLFQTRFGVSFNDYEVGVGVERLDRTFNEHVDFRYGINPYIRKSLSEAFPYRGFGIGVGFGFDSASQTGIASGVLIIACVMIYPLLFCEVMGLFVYWRYRKRKKWMAIIEAQEKTSPT